MTDISFSKKKGQKLGMKIHYADPGEIFIKEVNPEGAAADSGVTEGDKIVSCNGKSFESLTKEEALDVLKNVGNRVKLVVDKEQSPAKRKRRRMTNGASDEDLRAELQKVKEERDYLRKILKNIKETSASALKST